MADAPHVFTASGAQRIANAVRAVERLGGKPIKNRSGRGINATRFLILAKTTEAIPYRKFGEVKVWRPSSDDDATTQTYEADDDETYDAYAWCVPSGKRIKSGDEVVCAFINGRWFIIQCLNCPEDIP